MISLASTLKVVFCPLLFSLVVNLCSGLDQMELINIDSGRIYKKHGSFRGGQLEVGFEKVKRTKVFLLAIDSSLNIPKSSEKYFDEIGIDGLSLSFQKLSKREQKYALAYLIRKDISDVLASVDRVINQYDHLRLRDFADKLGETKKSVPPHLLSELLGTLIALEEAGEEEGSLWETLDDRVDLDLGYKYVLKPSDFGPAQIAFRDVTLRNAVANYRRCFIRYLRNSLGDAR